MAESSQQKEKDEREKKLRKEILSIYKDDKLTQEEKTKRVQELMGGKHKPLTQLNETEGDDEIIDVASLESDEEEKERKLKDETIEKTTSGYSGCKHYQTLSIVRAECCKKWVKCRVCHDAKNDHEMDRYATKLMKCMECQTTQAPSQQCINCKKVIARYFCGICNLWENNPEKNIYHCGKCKICRIGKGPGVDVFHCDKCGVCMSIERKDHKCIENALDSNCPICGEFLFSSRAESIFLNCGHPIHTSCFREYQQTSYQCPFCLKSFFSDMSEHWKTVDQFVVDNPTPEEYRNRTSTIFCNDCETRSDCDFHFSYHKCKSCGSYNTSVLNVTIHENSKK